MNNAARIVAHLLEDDDDESDTKRQLIGSLTQETVHKKLVSLAIKAAELVLHIFEEKYPQDKRPRQAIEAARTWLNNPSEETSKAAAAAATTAYAATVAYAAASAISAASAAVYTAAYAAYIAASAVASAVSAAYAASYAIASAAGAPELKARLQQIKERIDWLISCMTNRKV